jgi:radical SAM protein with 4Fe4S-binding SPASM domain
MWHSCVMTWDGSIVPCCFDKDAKYSMGNINEKTFGEIWNGDAYRDFRAQLFTNRKSIDICRNCTEGLKM